MLRVRLIGALRVDGDGASVAWPAGRRAGELLAYLALYPGAHPRLALAERFWPDVLERSARASLRTALHELRVELGGSAGAVRADRDVVELDASAWVDARAFAAALVAGRDEEAAGLGDGVLLPGLDAEWAVLARDEHRAALDGALRRLAEAAAGAGDGDRAVALARRRAAVDPLSEEAARALATALARAGDRAAAVRVLDGIVGRIARELRAAPSRQTRALADDLREAHGPPPPVVPLPDALVRAERPAGRRRVLAALADAAATDSARVVLLAGEPGIGKTTVAAAHARRAHAAGAVVLYGRSDEETLAPYQPFVEALGGLVRSEPPDRRAALLRRHPELAPFLPGVADLPASEVADATAARYRAFEGVRGLLDELAISRPVVLVLDDLHWADAPTLLLLRHLGRALGKVRVVLVGTYRDTEVRDDHGLAAAIAELTRERVLITLRLDGLAAAELGELAARAGRRDNAGVLGVALRERTAGNPFFAAELLRDLAERDSAGDQLAELAVPPGVAALVRERVRRLGDDAVEVLTAAALTGRTFDLRDVEAVCSVPDALTAVEAAAGAGLLAEDADAGGEAWTFSHALVQETLLALPSEARRRRLRLALADALERRLGATAAPEIARHRLGALPAGTLQAALRWSGVAAAQAAAALAWEDAAHHHAQALDALRCHGPSPREEAQLLLRLGDAHQRAGGSDDARAAFLGAAEAARALDDAELLAHAALGAGGLALVVTDASPPLVALLREALAALGDEPGALRTQVLGRLAIELAYADPPAAEQLSAAAVAAATTADDDDAQLAAALAARRAAIWAPEHAEERLAVTSDVVRHARRARDREAELHGRNWRVVDLLELGHAEEARAEVGAFAELADAVGLPHHRWYVPLWGATFAMLEGRAADARRLRAEAAALGARAQDPNAAAFATIQEFAQLFEERRFLDVDVDEIRRSRRPLGRRGWSGFVALVLWHQGRSDEARAEWTWISQDDFARVPQGANWHLICDAADACAVLGEREQAEQLYARLIPHARLFPVVARAILCRGSAEYHLGRVATAMGDADRAIAHFERAAAANAGIGAVPRAALARHELARLLSQRDPEHAERLARGAVADVERLGLDAFAAELRLGRPAPLTAR